VPLIDIWFTGLIMVGIILRTLFLIVVVTFVILSIIAICIPEKEAVRIIKYTVILAGMSTTRDNVSRQVC
jgi:hypothetical protein